MLPPGADVLQQLLDRESSSAEVAAALEAVQQLLLLVPVLLAAAAAFPFDIPLQLFWFYVSCVECISLWFVLPVAEVDSSSATVVRCVHTCMTATAVCNVCH